MRFPVPTGLDLFACVYVSDLPASQAWYEQLLGAPPSFLPNDVEAVWDLAEHRYLYVELSPEHAGHSQLTLFLGEYDDAVAAAAERGIEPAERETYDNGVHKATYHDPDGNRIGFGGGPT
jgi:catechol 2,3-dioxygenase-like lactoylglutathione lyase family enzyme